MPRKTDNKNTTFRKEIMVHTTFGRNKYWTSLFYLLYDKKTRVDSKDQDLATMLAISKDVSC